VPLDVEHLCDVLGTAMLASHSDDFRSSLDFVHNEIVVPYFDYFTPDTSSVHALLTAALVVDVARDLQVHRKVFLGERVLASTSLAAAASASVYVTRIIYLLALCPDVHAATRTVEQCRHVTSSLVDGIVMPPTSLSSESQNALIESARAIDDTFRTLLTRISLAFADDVERFFLDSSAHAKTK
jgi:hypothetical protein